VRLAVALDALELRGEGRPAKGGDATSSAAQGSCGEHGAPTIGAVVPSKYIAKALSSIINK